MKRVFLTEDFRQKLEVVETTTDGLPTRIKAIVQQADKVNLNQRIYPRQTLNREIERFNVDPQRRPGLIDHPDEGWSSVADIGIRWEKVWMEDDGNVWGEGLLVETQKGNDFRAVIKAGVDVGISSRGYATAKRVEVGGKPAWRINDDYELISFDAVVDPGVADARVKQAEQLERMMNEELTQAEVETAEEQAKALDEATASEVTEESTETPAEEVVVEEPVVAEEAVEETVAEEPVVEETKAEEIPAADAPAVDEVDPRVAELTETLTATEARNVELEAQVAEAQVSAADLGTQVANLKAAMAALVQVAKDALDREDFWSTCQFADTADFAKWMADYLDDVAEGMTEEPMEAKKPENPALAEAAEPVRALLASFNKARVATALADKVKDERYALLVFRRVLPQAERVEDLDALIAKEIEAAETAVVARRTQIAPRGNPSEATKPTDPAAEEALRLHREMLKTREQS